MNLDLEGVWLEMGYHRDSGDADVDAGKELNEVIRGQFNLALAWNGSCCIGIERQESPQRAIA